MILRFVLSGARARARAPLRSLATTAGKSSRELYDLLGVTRFALRHEIKAGYMKAAKRLHPDRNPSPLAKEQFQKVQQAYAILNNPVSRRLYDAEGTVEEPTDESSGGSAPQRPRGARSGYQKWKAEVFGTIVNATWRTIGIDDVDAYIAQMKYQFHHALASAREGRDLQPAKEFASRYKMWLIGGTAVTVLASPCVPLIMLFTAQLVKKLDENAGWLQAWVDGRVRWSPGDVLRRKLVAWARQVVARLRHVTLVPPSPAKQPEPAALSRLRSRARPRPCAWTLE
eukprot:2915670-Prymnesium_polylepis.1